MLSRRTFLLQLVHAQGVLQQERVSSPIQAFTSPVHPCIDGEMVRVQSCSDCSLFPMHKIKPGLLRWDRL